MSEAARSGETASAQRPRPKRKSARKKAPPARDPSPRRGRVVLGLVLVLLAFPFLGLAVGWPHLSGSLGAWVASRLFALLGKAALLVPLWILGWGLHLLGSPVGRHLRIPVAAPILLLDLIVLAERMGHQGGALGSLLDRTLTGWLGPGGVWIVAVAGLALGLTVVCRISLEEVLETASTLADWSFRPLGALGRALHRAATAPLKPPEPPPEASVQPMAPPPPGSTADPRSWEELDEREPAEPNPLGRGVQPLDRDPTSLGRGSTSLDDDCASLDRGSAPFDCDPESRDPASLDPASLDPASLDGASLDGDPASLEGDPAPFGRDRDSPDGNPDSLKGGANPPASGPPGCVSVPPALAPTGPSSQPARSASAPPGPSRAALRLEEGVMEDPGGQLRLFPGPAPAPAVRYKLPPLALLDDKPVAVRVRAPEDKSQVLLDALESFGVQARLLQIVRGPTVTRYELLPARGVKVNRFTSLTNDIALALASTSVRIEAPIPGKSAIGIEIPNEQNEMVVLKEILNTSVFRKSIGLAMGLGKDQGGNPVLANLQRMPHLLVAGTTGSGKSVCVNCLILSLLYRFTPRQVQLMMVDPKQVELSIYQGIPHLVGFSNAPEGEIIVDPKKAALALHQVVELMESRYKLFAEARVRNLEEYNLKAAEPLPWFVVIIDELADLMMVASKAVETSICRLAQKARASGIHMVVATQRPSADVITGLIKVNIPSRIAFAVSSQVDSRVILDTGGAEHLLGKGDMLFLPVDASDPRRLQGAFLSNEEIQRVVEWWKAQASPENLIELDVDGAPSLEGLGAEDEDDDDGLCDEALQVVVRRQQASASLLQTELKVGYARARRILNLLEKKGYVGQAEGSKPRKILYGGGGE